MKRIKKSLPPNPLTIFKLKYPNNSFNDFKNYFDSYALTKEIIFKDQNGLCAYCEDNLLHLDVSERQIEHYHDKSDKSDNSQNWGLEWSNVFGTCRGGSTQHPVILSCDAYKNHILKSPNTEGVFLNPLNMPIEPIFNFDKLTGELKPNIVICKNLDFYTPNQHQTFLDLVNNTIRVLNLNCERLKTKRLTVLHEYNRLLAKARKNNDINMVSSLTEYWLRNSKLPFFTVRRSLLGKSAEAYLANNSYIQL